MMRFNPFISMLRARTELTQLLIEFDKAEFVRLADIERRRAIGKLKSIRSAHYTGTDGRKVRAS
ncbi:MAG: hypothetical protein ACFB0Z_01875 [Candidatus Phaeomarinobacter sp.]